ncbi:MAG: hypothetical protein HKN79_12590 [Flavobacteriales bacterium]|nr:hypothetical protein [Flavobacteriales bacterium]
MYYVLIVIGLIACVLSVKDRMWTLLVLSLAAALAPLLFILDPSGLFYHALGLMIMVSLGLGALMWLDRAGESKRSRLLIPLTLIPFVTMLIFKLLSLQGIQVVQYSLLITVGAFIYLTIERRRFDGYWFLLLYCSVWSLVIFTF